MEKQSFLGLDLSTQSITVVLIDMPGEDIQQFSINFDETYPTYGTGGGRHYRRRPHRRACRSGNAAGGRYMALLCFKTTKKSGGDTSHVH